MHGRAHSRLDAVHLSVFAPPAAGDGCLGLGFVIVGILLVIITLVMVSRLAA